MKMYILIKEEVPAKLVPVISAHSSLACYLKFKDDTEMQIWVTNIFKKVVCKVTDIEFEKAKTFEKHLVLTESAFEGKEVAIVFCQREEFPKPFKFYKMWTP